MRDARECAMMAHGWLWWPALLNMEDAMHIVSLLLALSLFLATAAVAADQCVGGHCVPIVAEEGADNE